MCELKIKEHEIAFPKEEGNKITFLVVGIHYRVCSNFKDKQIAYFKQFKK